LATDYKDFFGSQLPPWMQDTYGKVLARAVGDLKDDLLARCKEGVKSRFPDYAAPDALAQIGTERQIDRGPGETRASYAARLKAAWETWPYAGTPTGVLSALFWAGYTQVELITQKGKHWRRNPTTGIAFVNYDNAAGYTFTGSNFWNTFIVHIYGLPASWVTNGVPQSDSNEAINIRRLIKKWKSGHSIVPRIVISNGGHFWGEQGLDWGDAGFNWGAGGVYVWDFDIWPTWGDGSTWGS
jgi:hypothetical protein